MNLNDFGDPLTFSTTSSCHYCGLPQNLEDIHGTQIMDPNEFMDLLIFALAPPWLSHFVLMSKMSKQPSERLPLNLTSLG